MTHQPWDDAAARELLARAARAGVATPPAGSRARVWAKIEAERARQLAPRRRWKLPAFALAAAACAVAIAVVRTSTPATALVIASSGTPIEVAAGHPLPALAESALVDLPAVGRMVAGPGTLATLDRFDAKNVSITLSRGSLLAHVTPRHERAPFIIHTRDFTARVVGTVLRVVAHADGSASIAVGHGAVEVQPASGAPVLVKSGERWPREASDAPSADELSRLGAADLEGAGLDSFGAVAPKPQAAAAAPSRDCKPLHGEAAVSCWLAVAEDASDSIRSESALYQAGWIRMHELGDAAFAIGIWERQRTRHPRGLLRDEAQTSIIDALVSLGRTRAAEVEIADYLRAHPEGLRSAEMHFVRATLLRADDRSCRRARHELDLALQHPAAPWAARARSARLACK
jgi:hypothetical protein